MIQRVFSSARVLGRATLLGAALLGVACLCLPASAQLKIAAPDQKVEAPFSLTAADGTGLELVALDTRAVVDGPLAFTEVHLTFENPQNRTMEGHFKVTMPDGAAISRFAMEINGKWMEGEVVEKQAARRAYEDALHRRQDPALLEQDSGNVFRARVFPIPARGQKRLIISWSHNLTEAGEAYRMPLKGLPKLRNLTLSALVGVEEGGGLKSTLGGTASRYQVSRVEKQNYTPEEDWVVTGGKLEAGGEALRHSNLSMARFTVNAGTAPEQIPTAYVMFDTSASRAVEFERRLQDLKTLVNSLGQAQVTSVKVMVFDQSTQEIYSGSPEGFGDDQLKVIAERTALGASNLEQALQAIPSGAPSRVIFVTDGMITAGERDLEALGARAGALAQRGVMRTDVVVDTTARDPLVLEALVGAELPRAGKIIDGRAPLNAQIARLARQTLTPVKITVPGAKWSWPGEVKGLQEGDTVIAFADLAEAKPFSLKLSGGHTAEVAPKARGVERPLLERAWVAARIDRLQAMRTEGDPDMKGALKQQIITLSTRHRVLSPFTALVVLETEAEYRRFGIDRTALADILTVGPTGVELKGRTMAMAVDPVQPVTTKTAENQAKPQKKVASKGRRASDESAKMEVEADKDDFGGAPAAAPAEMADGLMEDAEEVAGGLALEGTGRGGGGTAAGAVTETAVAAADPAAPPPAPEPEPEPVAERNMREEAPADDARPRTRRAPQRVASARRPSPDPFPGSDNGRVNRVPRRTVSQGRREYNEINRGKPALTGKMAEIMADIEKGNGKAALAAAMKWREEAPLDLLALVALGQGYMATGQSEMAARAFGSILDFYPSRADMRRFAGNWLEKVGEAGMALAADTYGTAAEQRPDHPSVYHQQAMVLVREKKFEQALTVVLDGIKARRVANRFRQVERILREDAALIGAAWIAHSPDDRKTIEARLKAHGVTADTAPTIRFVLTWETDANDVDFHIFDKDYQHAFYSRKQLSSGGELYADITTGYGPECFTVHNPKAFPYRLKAHYYRRGPLGYGMGKVQVIRHDGEGNLSIEDRPFVIMNDGAYVDLGEVKGSKKAMSMAK
ncbi:MAG: VIT domain-containing protein [Bradymonadia bacterium]